MATSLAVDDRITCKFFCWVHETPNQAMICGTEFTLPNGKWFQPMLKFKALNKAIDNRDEGIMNKDPKSRNSDLLFIKSKTEFTLQNVKWFQPMLFGRWETAKKHSQRGLLVWISQLASSAWFGFEFTTSMMSNSSSLHRSFFPTLPQQFWAFIKPKS